MNITPLSAIADMADGLPVIAVQGTVKVAMEVEHGIGKTSGKPWNKQFFVLAQNGAEIAATMWDAEGNEMKKGETVLIENTQNKKGQWSGMTKGSYTNKKKELCHTLEIRANQVKIKPLSGGVESRSATDEAKALCESEMGSERLTTTKRHAESGVSASAPVILARKTVHSGSSAPPAQNSDGINEARQHIMQSVNLYNLCVDAVDNCIKPHIEGMTAEFYQAAVGTLFIEASRAGLVSKMPIKPLPVHNGNEKAKCQTSNQEEHYKGDIPDPAEESVPF